MLESIYKLDLSKQNVGFDSENWKGKKVNPLSKISSPLRRGASFFPSSSIKMLEIFVATVEVTLTEVTVVETVADEDVEVARAIGNGGAVGPVITTGPVEGPITAFADAIPIVSLIAVVFADASAVGDDSSAFSIATDAFADVATTPFFVSVPADAALSATPMATELSEGATSVTGPDDAPLTSTESSFGTLDIFVVVSENEIPCLRRVFLRNRLEFMDSLNWRYVIPIIFLVLRVA